MSVNEKVLDAIELLTKNSVQKAKYDKTIPTTRAMIPASGD